MSGTIVIHTFNQLSHMWQFIVGIVAFISVPFVNGLTYRQPEQVTAYHVLGRCHDMSTAVGLKANIYCIDNQTRRLLATSNNDGLFDALVPASATHLILEGNAYRSITIPIHFASGIPADARFSLFNRAMMTPLDSMAVPLSSRDENFVDLYITVPDSISVTYITY